MMVAIPPIVEITLYNPLLLFTIDGIVNAGNVTASATCPSLTWGFEWNENILDRDGI